MFSNQTISVALLIQAQVSNAKSLDKFTILNYLTVNL